ncbi:NADPH:quinone oxidoreductase family protein [Oricola sp.]|uniref:NADPH:quinone oxidoreductase family protein n=1 Tax=Oricola sp. TaxID=1979950 RepID=UPI0025E17ABF|nr:NADPH:quinone oxidoreductase family protein [Oricola sp.]MCI5074202.1 NADPH:quinone oxidoreductase family protein [Oricola sp.]
MRAVVIRAWQEPWDLTVSETDVPVCGADAVRIAVRAVPVSHALGLLVRGKYQRKPDFPFVPGNTVVGEILEVGANAGRGLRVGQRVIASVEFGALAEQVVAPAVNVYPLPGGVDAAAATAINTSYNSVYAALTWPRLLDLRAGQTLLVHGAAGGAGSAAVEIARELGVRVIATASTEERRAWVRGRGADVVLASDPATLRDAVRAATGGKGVDAVLDTVGGELFTQSIRCLAPEGRIVPLGFASGRIPEVAANLILVKNISVCGLYMGYYKIDARDRYEGEVRAIFDTLGAWLAAGRINPKVFARLSLSNVGEAFRLVEDRGRLGHVVLEP